VRKIWKIALASTIGSVVVLGTAAAPAEAAATYQGCPAGYVCLYPQNAGWNGGHPSFKWFRYGSYNLVNQFGTHRFLNNQTGGAVAQNCKGYNGTNCLGVQPAGSWWDWDYTPINSVRLAAS
jgi:hypothetical protein